MRTTVTLDPDAETLLRNAVRQRGVSFKRALNEAIRAGLKAPVRRAGHFRQPTFRMGAGPSCPGDRALALASALEDQELARKLSLGR